METTFCFEIYHDKLTIAITYEIQKEKTRFKILEIFENIKNNGLKTVFETRKKELNVNENQNPTN